MLSSGAGRGVRDAASLTPLPTVADHADERGHGLHEPQPHVGLQAVALTERVQHLRQHRPVLGGLACKQHHVHVSAAQVGG